jgi:5'-3' exonuclease
LGYLIGSKALLEKHIEKLPICNFIISEVKESFLEFDLRKIRWAIKQLMDIELDVSAWRVRRLAGITRLDNEAIDREIKNYF